MPPLCFPQPRGMCEASSSDPIKSRLTLDGGLGAGGGDGAHSADHEVGEEHVGAGGRLAHVFAEVGDLGGLALALEGALEGGGRGTLEGSRGGESANGPGGGGSGAHGGAGNDRDGRHCVGRITRVDRERSERREGVARAGRTSEVLLFRSRGRRWTWAVFRRRN